MENQNNHSNKGIVIAVLCLIIGVVLGSMLMNNKAPVGSQQGASLDSKYAQVAIDGDQEGLCPEGQIYSDGECYDGTIGASGDKQAQVDNSDKAVQRRLDIDARIKKVIEEFSPGSSNPSGLYVMYDCNGVVRFYNESSPNGPYPMHVSSHGNCYPM